MYLNDEEQYVSKDFICMQLHAMSEFMNLFFSKDITIQDCCVELNISDFQELIALSNIMILINNFSEQKDYNHSLTRNDDYIKDEYDAFNFDYIKLIDCNRSPKQIIKEVRDAFEHKSFYLKKDGNIYVNNKRTNFKASIHPLFLIGAFFYNLNANNMNYYLVDDRDIDYSDSIENNIEENLKIYRAVAKGKKDERIVDGYAKQDLVTLTRNLTFNDDEYKYVEIELFDDEKQSLIEFFNDKEFNKENFFVAMSMVLSIDGKFSCIVNDFIFRYFNGVNLKYSDTRDITKQIFKNLDTDSSYGERQNNILKSLVENNKFYENYFKILFIKYVYGNLDYENNEENTHIRNCFAHSKYVWLNSEEILLKDFPNGVNNESKITFMKKYYIDELYNSAKELWINQDEKQL